MGFSLKSLAKGAALGFANPILGSNSLLKDAMGGGGPQDQTQTTNNAPWSVQQPYLQQGFSEAQRLYNSGPSTVVPFSNETNQALQMQAQRAQNGSPLVGAAQNSLQNTLNGNYLFGGPGFNAAFQAAANKINPMVSSQFSGAGRLHSGLADVARTQALGDAFAGLYGQERNNQMQAASMAPQLAQQDYADINALRDVGSQREQLAQQYANEPYNRLQQYQQSIMGNYGGTSTTTQPIYRNPLSGALGGAMAGASVGGLPGAIGGGLLGYYGSR